MAWTEMKSLQINLQALEFSTNITYLELFRKWSNNKQKTPQFI